ncbi:50S ribosomal protein L17 [Patescibacteria group bacterium]|nr:50S ribosomal protein L17 [Patescibacteria group bacterium]
MKHKIRQRTLGRTATKRLALMRNMSGDLLRHGQIVTTAGRAKELRRFLEPLITAARGKSTLAQQRRLRSVLLTGRNVFNLMERADKTAKRPGGYLRLHKLGKRQGDGAPRIKVSFTDQE